MIRRFTIIELLIVVAILAILFSILLPSLRKARDKAHRAVCLSNVSQIYRISATYSLHNDKRLLAPYTHNGLRFLYVIDGKIFKSLNLVSEDNNTAGTVFDCPANRNDPRGWRNLHKKSQFHMDHYSITTTLQNKSKFNGKNSPTFIHDPVGIAVTESIIKWPADPTWTGAHSKADRGGIWTKLKFDPIGYNSADSTGAAKWRWIDELDRGLPTWRGHARSRFWWSEKGL